VSDFFVGMKCGKRTPSISKGAFYCYPSSFDMLRMTFFPEFRGISPLPYGERVRVRGA